MLSVQNLSLFFGERVLFDQISFQVIPKERVGLVGKNGAGKSTLLKVLADLQRIDGGAISKAKGIRVGYLPQEMHHQDENTIFQEAQTAFKAVNAAQERIDVLQKSFETRTDYESDLYQDDLQELCDLNERLGLLDAYQIEEKIEKILLGLGFTREDFVKQMKDFSGGWKMRVELAKLLLENPDVLLLDEPTNHLDIESIEWLETFLIQYSGAILLISHDKMFLDHVTNRTIEISRGEIYDYRYAYSKYLLVRAEELERQKAAYAQQQKEIEKTQVLIDKFRAKASKASFAQSLIKKLDRMDRIELDEVENSAMRLRFQVQTQPGKVILQIKNIHKHFGEKKVLRGIDAVISRGEKIALIGKNGYGKSTLLKIIMQELQADAGEIEWGHNVKIGYFAQNQTDLLDPNKTVFQSIDDEAEGEVRKQVRNLLGCFLFGGDDVLKKVKVLSGGEKGRLALCKLLLHDYNCLILDEPTNHLDIVSKNILKDALKKYEGTLILVSHDRDFLQGLSDQIYEIDQGTIRIHHNDILTFLEEKKARSIAEFEQNKIALSEKNTKNHKNTQKNAAKLITENPEKNQKKIEKEIETLELKIADFEKNNLPNLDYNDKEDIQALQQYELLKKKLADLFKDWID